MSLEVCVYGRKIRSSNSGVKSMEGITAFSVGFINITIIIIIIILISRIMSYGLSCHDWFVCFSWSSACYFINFIAGIVKVTSFQLLINALTVFLSVLMLCIFTPSLMFRWMFVITGILYFRLFIDRLSLFTCVVSAHDAFQTIPPVHIFISVLLYMKLQRNCHFYRLLAMQQNAFVVAVELNTWYSSDESILFVADAELVPSRWLVW